MGPKKKVAGVDLGPLPGDQGAPKNLAVAILPPRSDPHSVKHMAGVLNEAKYSILCKQTKCHLYGAVVLASFRCGLLVSDECWTKYGGNVVNKVTMVLC